MRTGKRVGWSHILFGCLRIRKELRAFLRCVRHWSSTRPGRRPISSRTIERKIQQDTPECSAWRIRATTVLRRQWTSSHVFRMKMENGFRGCGRRDKNMQLPSFFSIFGIRPRCFPSCVCVPAMSTAVASAAGKSSALWPPVCPLLGFVRASIASEEGRWGGPGVLLGSEEVHRESLRRFCPTRLEDVLVAELRSEFPSSNLVFLFL